MDILKGWEYLKIPSPSIPNVLLEVRILKIGQKYSNYKRMNRQEKGENAVAWAHLDMGERLPEGVYIVPRQRRGPPLFISAQNKFRSDPPSSSLTVKTQRLINSNSKIAKVPQCLCRLPLVSLDIHWTAKLEQIAGQAPCKKIFVFNLI